MPLFVLPTELGKTGIWIFSEMDTYLARLLGAQLAEGDEGEPAQQ